MDVSPLVRWRFSLSSTLRGIYVIRYFLFSGGAAIAGALVERATTETVRPILGLIAGFAAGLLVFRSQLRPLSWPTLALSQDAVYLIRRRRAAVVPWGAIEQISQDGRFVALRLTSPMQDLQGEPIEEIRLEARKFGIGRESLGDTLTQLSQDERLRSQLPTDARLRQLLAVPST